MRQTFYIAAFLLLLLSDRMAAFAQNQNSLVIADDRLILHIDLRSPVNVLDSMFKTAGISNITPGKIKKRDFTLTGNDGWNIASRKDSIIEFERLLTDLHYGPQSKPYLITTSIPNIEGKPGYPAEVKYGVNKYAKITVYELPTGLTRFILPGYERAKRVFLSGSFNEWSTLKGLMKKTDGGWLLDLKLGPGAYEYKYIVDGRWMTDPNDLVQTHDGGGNMNSLFFKYNYTFKLAGYPSAQRITVAGDFNDFDANELLLEKKGMRWQREMYLADGRYKYHFTVDGQWLPDPANPRQEKDKNGKVNSILNLGETVVFKLSGYPGAKKVFLSGDVNSTDTAMVKKGNLWILPLVLTGDDYSYRFVVDDVAITDPADPHYSIKNKEKYSFLAVRPNHTFVLKGHEKAKKVTLCGVFNDWEPDGYSMVFKDGEWTIPFHLKPGKYLYKFRVDGDWIIDPDNKFWEQNQEHTGNSVLWVQ